MLHRSTRSDRITRWAARPRGRRPSGSICHIDEGFDFLGFRIQRRTKRGTTQRMVYTYPSKKALASIVGRVRALTLRSAHPTLAALLRQLNPVLRGWCTYFRHGVSKATFGYLDQYTWHRSGPVDPQATQQDEVGRPAPTLPTRLASHRGRGRVVPAPGNDGQPLPLPGRQHRHTLGKNSIRIGRIARRDGLVESLMRGDTHVRLYVQSAVMLSASSTGGDFPCVERVPVHRTQHNQRSSRKASSASEGRYLPGVIPRGAVLAIASSLSAESACS
jgi:hypothetical protein